MREDMKITYLGTGAAEGIPAMFCTCELCTKARHDKNKEIRTRSQCVINDDLLIDFPADTYYHFLLNDINMSKIKYIVITHSHQDHFYPEDMALNSPSFSESPQPTIQVYANSAVINRWEDTINREYPKYDYSKYIAFNKIENLVRLRVGEYEITALKADHKKNEECFIYDIKYGSSRLLYANDTGINLEPSVWEYFRTVHYDMVSMDCTGMNKEVGRYHMGIIDNIKFIRKLTETGTVDDKTNKVITHFSHFGGLSHQELVKLAKDLDFTVAYDGLQITL